MSEIRVNNLSNESNSGGPTISGITTFSSPYFFVPPVGNTEQRPQNPQKGALRFNTDTKHLEYYRGSAGWSELEASNEELNGGHRGLIQGGNSSPNWGGKIDYFNIATLGSSAVWGDQVHTQSSGTACASRTRAVCAGGNEPGTPAVNHIQYNTIASTGTSTDFGDLTQARWGLGAVSNQTRGVFAGGSSSGDENNGLNIMDYITIASTGNAVDYGDITSGVYMSGCASSTRGVYQIGKAGASPSTTNSNIMEYITTATTGNTTDFGDALGAISGRQSCSNSTRGVVAGGSPGYSNVIEYITIASTGNSTDFGDLFQARYWCSGVASPTRAVWSGGYRNSPSAGFDTTQDYVEIMTTGNALDFGDVATTAHPHALAACSNGHGGL